MQSRSVSLSDTQWLLRVGSRGRITLPKALCAAHDLRPGDILGWETMKSGKSFLVRNLSRELRDSTMELISLRGAPPGSPEDLRVDKLGATLASLAGHIYPVGQPSTASPLARIGFDLSQTEEKVQRTIITDKVDAVLADLEAKRLAYDSIRRRK